MGAAYWMYASGRFRRILTRRKCAEDGIMVDGDDINGSVVMGKWHKAIDARHNGGNREGGSANGSTISVLTAYNSTLRDEGDGDDSTSGWSTIDSRSQGTTRTGGSAGGSKISRKQRKKKKQNLQQQQQQQNLNHHEDDDENPTR